MDDKKGKNHKKEKQSATDKMVHDIEKKHLRKMRARQIKKSSMWFGLGMMGTIGWTVAVPTLLGVALGIWLDSRWPSSLSWTLTLMLAGLLLGCLNAWLWVSREQNRMEQDKEYSDMDQSDE